MCRCGNGVNLSLSRWDNCTRRDGRRNELPGAGRKHLTRLYPELIFFQIAPGGPFPLLSPVRLPHSPSDRPPDAERRLLVPGRRPCFWLSPTSEPVRLGRPGAVRMSLITAKYVNASAQTALQFNSETGWRAVSRGLRLVVLG